MLKLDSTTEKNRNAMCSWGIMPHILKMTIDDIMYEESLLIDKFVEWKEPFEYIDYIIKHYPPIKSKMWWIDKTLDTYNWYIRENVNFDVEKYTLYKISNSIIYEHFLKEKQKRMFR